MFVHFKSACNMLAKLFMLQTNKFCAIECALIVNQDDFLHYIHPLIV